MRRIRSHLVALSPLMYGLSGCGGDATAVNLAPLPEAVSDAASETGVASTPDAATDAAHDTTSDTLPEAAPDAQDSSVSDVVTEAGVDAAPVDPVSCTPAATATFEVHVVFHGLAYPEADLTAHCSDGRFFAATKADADGFATIEVPEGGLVTTTCPQSLTTVGSIEEGVPLELTCAYYGPPGGRPPNPDFHVYAYTVGLMPFPGAASYQVRGNAGSAESLEAGLVTLSAFSGKGDIVAYALDTQAQRIAAASKLDVSLFAGAMLDLGPFDLGVYPASVSLIHPRVEDDYVYTATLETSREKTIETESVVAVLEAGEAASLSTRFAANVAQWNTLKVRYELSDASGRYSSGLFVRQPSDNLPFESEIDLTTDMLPLMLAPTLAPAARPILDFEQPGPPTCLAGSADRLTVQLYAKHPNGRRLHWNLQLPGDTSAPWTLPELGVATAQEYWPGEQMTPLAIDVTRLAFADPETDVPVCTSRAASAH
jgi:hypothetical protein